MTIETCIWTSIFIALLFFNYEINRKTLKEIKASKEQFAYEWNNIKIR